MFIILTVVVHVRDGAVLGRCFVDIKEYEKYLQSHNIEMAVRLNGSQVSEELTSFFTSVEQVE